MSEALLVIDVQNIYTDANSELFCTDSANTVKRINKIINHFDSQKGLIIYVKHIHKVDGSDLGRMFDYAGPVEDFNFKEGQKEVEYDPNLIIARDAFHIKKTRYSAFARTELESMLKSKNISTITIVGFMANFCCESTARDAHSNDYYVNFITDATGAPALSEELNEETIRRLVSEFLAAGFAQTYNTENYLRSFQQSKK